MHNFWALWFPILSLPRKCYFSLGTKAKLVTEARSQIIFQANILLTTQYLPWSLYSGHSGCDFCGHLLHRSWQVCVYLRMRSVLCLMCNTATAMKVYAHPWWYKNQLAWGWLNTTPQGPRYRLRQSSHFWHIFSLFLAQKKKQCWKPFPMGWREQWDMNIILQVCSSAFLGL